MARLVFGMAGAALGSLTPFGPSFGWMAGQLLAGALFPEQLPDVHQQGQRLSDLSVQSSAYGAMIPWIRGSCRLGGNIIWSKPLEEVVTTTSQEQGGKGGPTQTVTTTTYQYFATFAIAYCQGSAAGARRMWINGEMIIDYGINANSQDIVLTNENWKGSFTFYPGSEDQVVDTIMEEYEGVGESSAYRGTCFVLFHRLDVTANHIVPLIEAEVVFDGAIGQQINYYGDIGTTESVGGSTVQLVHVKEYNELWFYDTKHNNEGSVGNPCRVAVWNLGTGAASYISFPDLYPGVSTGDGPSILYLPQRDVVLVSTRYLLGTPFHNTTNVYRASTKQLIGSWQDVINSSFDAVAVIIDTARNRALISDSQFLQLWQLSDTCMPESALAVEISATGTGYAGDFIDKDGIYWLTHADGNKLFARIDGETGVRLSDISSDADESTSNDFNIAYDEARHCAYYWSNITAGVGTEYLKKYDMTTGVMTRIYTDPVGSGGLPRAWPGYIKYDPVIDRVLALQGGAAGPFGLFVINPSNGTFTLYQIPDNGGAHFQSNGFAFSTGVQNLVWAHSSNWINGADNSRGIGELRFNALTQNNPTHAVVAAAIFAEAGFQSGDINVTALAGQTVPGYAITRVGTYRQALEPLMHKYYTDYVESDGKIKAVLRGGSTVLTIPENDLGAAQFGTKSSPTIKSVRRQELDQPREVRVTYPDQDSNYQVGVQYERMLGGDFKEIQEFASSIVSNASGAKQMAARLLYSAHVARFQVQFQTSIKYAYLEPTDLVIIVRGNISYLIRILEKRISGNLIYWTGETDDPTVYSQTGVGAAVAYSISGIQGKGVSILYLLDIPLLREQDDSTGEYAIAVGSTAGWRGAELHKSSDGVNFSPLGVTFTRGAAVGNAVTALGNFAGGNRTDFTNQVTVSMYPGSADLVSVSRLDMFNGMNHAVLGNEIIAFRYATLISPGIYLLDGFLRGRAGTAQFMSTHEAGERFIVLSPGTLRDVQQVSSDINVTKHYKAVTIGSTLPETAAVPHTFQNVRQKCLPPVKLRGNRNGSNSDVLISWIRQTRYSPNWRDYADVPLGEPTEKYDLEIWNSTFTLLKRTYTDITTSSQNYTAGDQTTDFGGVQSTVYCRVYQKNQYGRGYVLQGSVI